jgi:glycosyltransferase involved in cell wall biosynthesis
MGYNSLVGQPRPYDGEGIGIAKDDGGLFGFDITVLKLMMHASVPQLFHVMQTKGQRVVVDIDDFHFSLHEENIAYSATNPHTNPMNNRMWYEIGIRQADYVTVSTAFLADFYGRRCRDVRLVRNAVETDRFSPVYQPDSPVYGWLGGTLWRSGDIELLSAWLPGFTEDHGVTVHHAGHIPGDPRHFAIRAGLKAVRTSSMKSISGVPEMLQNFHVGLVPLVRNAFNEAKSYLKGLEYAAAGIPFIATPTEEYRLLHASGVGRLASTPDEWRDHATELLDVNVRREEAQRQREIVSQKFDISGMGEAWASAITG